MKIAIIRKKYTFHGGAESFSSAFIQNLADSGHEVHIFAIKWQSDRTHKNIHFHRVPCLTFNSFLRDLMFAVTAYFMLKKKRNYFDIIQSHDKTLYQDIYRAGDGCHIMWLRHKCRKSGIAGKASIIFNPFHWLILLLEHMILKGHRFRKVIAISEMVKREIIENYSVPSEDIEVIYNGVDLIKYHPDNRTIIRGEIRKKHGLDDADFVILFVGSGFERKGVRYLIEAAKLINEPVTVLIVGKGSEKKFNKISPDPSLSKRGQGQSRQNIIFCGPQNDIRKYYAAADIFVFPTLYEPFGNVHLEALASGLPVITTCRSGAAELIQDDLHGYVIKEPDDTASISEKIQALYNDRKKLQQIGRNARQLAEGFTFEKHIGKICELYERVVKEKIYK